MISYQIVVFFLILFNLIPFHVKSSYPISYYLILSHFISSIYFSFLFPQSHRILFHFMSFNILSSCRSIYCYISHTNHYFFHFISSYFLLYFSYHSFLSHLNPSHMIDTQSDPSSLIWSRSIPYHHNPTHNIPSQPIPSYIIPFHFISHSTTFHLSSNSILSFI